jgi:hypothetical protein
LIDLAILIALALVAGLLLGQSLARDTATLWIHTDLTRSGLVAAAALLIA